MLACLASQGCRSGPSAPTLQQWRERQFRREASHSNRTAPGQQSSVSAATQPAGRGSHFEVSGSRVLKIDNETITVEEVLRPIRTRLETAAQTLDPADYYDQLVSTIRQQIITEVAERLIWREASRPFDDEMNKRLDLAVERIERELIDREYGGREPRYEAALAGDNTTREAERERVRRRVVVSQYVREELLPRTTPTREDLLAYYRENPAEFSRPARIEMFLIDIPFRAMLKEGGMNDPDQLAIARRFARERLEEARAKVLGGESFESVAKAYSRGLHADDGGRWGFISEPLREYWELPSKTAFSLRSGEVSAVLESDYGVFLVKTGKVEPGETISFEKAQSQISERVRDARLAQLQAAFLQARYERAAVGKLEPFIQAVIETAPESKRLGRGSSR